jgi:hypothetical protein
MRKLDEERRAQLDELARRKPADLPARRGPVDLDPGEVDSIDERGTVVALFSGAARKGSWEPPARLSVYSAFGGVELDFTNADLLEGTTEVEILAIFGGVGIKVPPDIDVESQGLGLFGGFSNHCQRAREDGAPLVRIKGLAIFGGVEIKVRKPKRR